MQIAISINEDDIIENLTKKLNREELIDFVKKLDMQVAEWDFTLELLKYFEEQKHVYDQEEFVDNY